MTRDKCVLMLLWRRILSTNYEATIEDHGILGVVPNLLREGDGNGPMLS